MAPGFRSVDAQDDAGDDSDAKDDDASNENILQAVVVAVSIWAVGHFSFFNEGERGVQGWWM